MTQLQKTETNEEFLNSEAALTVHNSELVSTADPMVSMIQRLAMDQNTDLAKLEKMLEMKERLEEKEARRAFSDAMAACQSEIQPVVRNKDNDQTKSKYADLAAIYDACKPIIAKHGFSFSTFPASTERDHHMGVRWILRHEGGHEESELAEIPLDDRGMKGTANKTQTHAFGSTVSYARRYLFCMLFDVATGDDDDGNTAGKSAATVSAEQYISLRDRAAEAGVAEETICLAHNVSDLSVFPAKDFEAAMNRLSRDISDNQNGDGNV